MAATQASTGPVIKLKSAKMVAKIEFVSSDNYCLMCRNSLLEACIKCEAAEFLEGGDFPVTGECGHSYHVHCCERLQRDAESRRVPFTCAYCGRDWKIATHSIA